MLKLYFKGIGMIVGLMFGAGVFALPYVFSKAGMFWGVFHFSIAFLILLFLYFLYSEIAYFTKGKHRFTGYVDFYLGKNAKKIAFFTTVASYYGSMLVYGLLGGFFITNIFNSFLGIDQFKASVLFFMFGAVLVFLRLGKIAEINFYLTVPLFGFVAYLLFAALPEIRVENLFSNISFSFDDNWFLPYGVWLFSLGGFAVLPEVRDFFEKSRLKDFRKVIVISLTLSAVFYFIFIVAVWGASNNETTPDALSGLIAVLGRKALIIGSLVGFLSVFTSYLAISADLKSIFRYDYHFNRKLSWVFTVFPPVGLFMLGISDFTTIIGVVGALGLGVTGIFIILMANSFRRKVLRKESVEFLRPTNGHYMKANRFIKLVVVVAILSGVIYELWSIFS